MGRLRTDALCGGFLLVIAIVFAVAALGYEIGTPRRMGPGFFPLMVAVILGGFGAVIGFQGLRETWSNADAPEVGKPIPWIPGLYVVAAVVFFGTTASGLGLVPSLAVSVLLASRAGQNTWRKSLIHCFVLTVLCALIFQVGLGLQLPLIGPWLLKH